MLFRSSIGDDQILGLDDTYNVNDTIDGGNGIDTLSLLFFAPETEVVALIHVENVVVRNAHASTKVEAGNWTGVDLLTFSSSTAATVVTQVREKLNIEVDGNNQNVSLTYADDILGSLDNTQQLWVNNSTAGVDIKTGGSDKITFLDILASGTSVISLAENDLETITISGNGDLQLLSSAPDNEQLIRVSSILASSVTSDLTLDMSAIDLTLTADYFVTIVTGSGNDIIWASNNDNRVNAGAGDDRVIIHSGLDEMDLLEGGTGTDVLSMTSADFVATASLDAVLSGITGFEFIAISDELDSDTAMDVSVYGVNSIVIEAGLAGNQTLTGFSNEATIEIQTDASETDVLTITMLGATNSGSNLDNLNIVFNTDLEAADDIYAAAFDVKGINLISVTTADSTITGETTAAGTLPDRSDGYELVLSNEGNLSTISVRDRKSVV